MPEALFGSDSSYSFSDRKRAKGNKLSVLEAEKPVRGRYRQFQAIVQVSEVECGCCRDIRPISRSKVRILLQNEIYRRHGPGKEEVRGRGCGAQPWCWSGLGSPNAAAISQRNQFAPIR